MKLAALTIAKTLSANDTGETGGHQAGILVPKAPEILSFFPPLDTSEKNPRHMLGFTDTSGRRWQFAFIYYNGRHFGGTRDEFRLTRMTPFLRQAGLVAGDELLLTRDSDGHRTVDWRRAAPSPSLIAGGVLRLGGGWKTVNIEAARKS